MDSHGRRLLAALDREGVLLQHDQVLPSASAVVAGEPVRGSWWAHPMAHPIYDALNSVEDDGHAVRVPLVLDKGTREAGRRLEPTLLVFTDEVHLPSGRHAKALLGWDQWASSHGIEAATSAAGARASIEVIVEGWGSPKSLLPWPPS